VNNQYSRVRAEPTIGVGTALVVDDDAWLRMVIGDILTDEGFRVELASDGTTAVCMAEQVLPDFILLDLGLPVQPGLETLHNLKARRPTREIPIILLSAYAMLLVRDDANYSDSGRVLQTSVDLKRLLDHINGLIREADHRFRFLPPTS
jgi:CheY-like chemotaxis protein